MTANAGAQPTAVQQQRRQVTINALLDAAQRGMIEHGFDVSIDDIAELAQVARRTVFRYFATREDLLSDAFSAASERYLSSMPEFTGDDWREWLADVAHVIHETSARAGWLYWEFTARRLPDRMAEVYAAHQRALHEFFDTTAETIWRADGGKGGAPPQLRQSVGAHLSPMFAQAVVLDAAGTAGLAAEMATEAIAATVHRLREP